MTLRTVSVEFAREHGFELPKNMQIDRGVARFKDRGKRVTLQDRQQEERTGVSKAQRRLDMTMAWHKSKDADTFAAELEKKGYTVAQGKRKALVVVDRGGEVYKLSRYVDRVKAADLQARLGTLRLESYADIQNRMRSKEDQEKAAELNRKDVAIRQERAFKEQSRRQRDVEQFRKMLAESQVRLQARRDERQSLRDFREAARMSKSLLGLVGTDVGESLRGTSCSGHYLFVWPAHPAWSRSAKLITSPNEATTASWSFSTTPIASSI